MSAPVNVTTRKYVLPTKPLTIIDAINRMWLATGSIPNAVRGADADYNGHNVVVWWNDYRKCWIAHYAWGGSNVIARSGLAACLEAAKRFYNAQGRGASVEVAVESDGDAAICEGLGFIPAEAEDTSWRDWKFHEINYARMMERHGFRPNTADLIAATSPEDFKSRATNANTTSKREHG